MLVKSGGLPPYSTCVLEAEPGKLGIERCEPGILFISLPTVSLFKLVIMTLLATFASIQLHWRHLSKIASSGPDKGACREIANVYQAMCNKLLM